MRRFSAILLMAGLGIVASVEALAQAPPPMPPPSFTMQQLEGLVAPIALYPDPLLAQVLTASTFSYQIPDAAGWSRAHSYITGDALARAIAEDNLPWDPSVIALLPFPSVIDRMAGDMAWTSQLGNAVLADRAAVMDAVQDQRQKALNYGYLKTGPQYRVVPTPGAIEILPVNPGIIFVPYYDPMVVYYRPRPGFFIGGAITFGPQIFIGAAFAPWGWGSISFAWGAHNIIVNNRPWGRVWGNREVYVHPYPGPPRPVRPAPRVERHEMREWREPARGGGREERREERH
ncbi:MAG TPA: DUF3300 domain-containing protein [Bryobacteraceae bacterium]|nr:DUF3300 domain-containing protein [Bryobacteraceae bacterium]